MQNVEVKVRKVRKVNEQKEGPEDSDNFWKTYFTVPEWDNAKFHVKTPERICHADDILTLAELSTQSNLEEV